MALNVTTAVFRPGFNIATASPSLVQWDQGQTLQFEGVELPSAYQVEFTNAVTVQAITMIGNENGVEIPNELLQQSFPITAYIVLHETAEDRETEYWATIYVKARQKPREETPDPEQISVIDQTIAALQDGVAEAQAAANEAAAASQAVQDMGVEAETLPEGSAATVEKTVDPETGVVTLTYGIPKGAKGDKGDKGNTGETYMLAPSVDTIVKNPNTGTFIPAQIIFTVYKVINGTSSPYRAAAIVADIFGSGMVPHYEVVNDYRLTVPINSIADTGYVACTAYGNGGIIATITIPCILDGAKGDPGEGVAPGGTTGQFLKKKSGEDYDTEWADVDPGVTSVNGKTGAVTLTASDVGAKPASYEAPVSSVNEKTGAVVLDAGDIGYESTTVEDELGTINSALTSLSAVTEIIDTASGAIASFPDGSGLPMRSLVAEINPVQDLHGQSSPYPPGGGKNLADPDRRTNLSGNIQLFYDSTGFLLKANTAYTLSWSTASAQASIDDIAGNRLSVNYGKTNITYTPTEDVYAKFDIYFNSGFPAPSGGTADVLVQLEVGSSATAYAPFSNICPISGHIGLSVEVTGFNVWDEETEIGGLTPSTGLPDSQQNKLRAKNKISCKPSTVYHFVNAGVDVYSTVCFYDADETFISAITNAHNGTNFTTPSNAKYFRFDIAATYGTTYNHDISINYPSTDTSYHAYQGEAISVSFPSTVYGGTDEVISGNGVITLAPLVFDGSAWNFTSGFFFKQVLPVGENISDYYVTENGIDMFINGTNGQARIYLARNPFLTEESDVGSMLNGYKLLYRLATPQTFTHDPQEVDTLYGQNNVWHDANGDTAVIYQANLKGYIDKVLGS